MLFYPLQLSRNNHNDVTSFATTAKPAPNSPALAASILAFKARIFCLFCKSFSSSAFGVAWFLASSVLANSHLRCSIVCCADCLLVNRAGKPNAAFGVAWFSYALIISFIVDFVQKICCGLWFFGYYVGFPPTRYVLGVTPNFL